MEHKKNEKGQSLIEILLAIGLMAILLPALIVGVVAARQGKPQQQQRLQAVTILRETNEAVRSVREKGWSYFANDGTFHPTTLADFSWTLSTGSATINGFTQQVVISDVYRATASGAIVQSAASGYLDPSTKKVVTTISWTSPYSSQIASTLYLTRHDNMTYIQTTVADFNAGTSTNTAVTNTSGGEVILGAGGGGGDWCQPSKSITTVDLPKNGVANAISAIEGSVFAGTGDNSSGVSFAKVSLDSSKDPPPASISATFDGYKTNAVFGENGYAYLGTDNHSKEVVIISLTQYSDSPTNSKYLEIGSIDLPGNISGVSVFVLNNKAYVTGSDNKFYIYDITTRSGTHSSALNGSGLALPGTGKKVVVVTFGAKTYAYIAVDSSSTQMDIVDVSTNPASPTIVGSVGVKKKNGTASTQHGVDVSINTTISRAYLATTTLSGEYDFYIFDISNPISPVQKGGYDTNGMTPTGVAVVTGNRVVIVGTGGTEQYQVINISNETNPTHCAGLSYATGVFGVAAVLQSNGYAYSYIITGDSNAELKIILGGAGGQYSSAGTFVSSPFDTSSVGLPQAVFNRFDATFIQPSQTTIGFQVAVANAVSNSCTSANYTYIGPNKTSLSSDVYASGSAMPIWSSGNYQNPGRCFRYKVYFTSNDSTQTPELDDFTVNYSP